MRQQVRRPLATLAILATAFAGVGLSAAPARALALTLTTVDNPVNQTNDQGILRASGTGTSGDTITLCATDTTNTTACSDDPTPPNVLPDPAGRFPVDADGNWSGELDLSTKLAQGALTVFAKSNTRIPPNAAQDVSNSLPSFKDTILPATPTQVSVDKNPINKANQAAVKVCGTVGGDANTTKITLTGGSTVLSQFFAAGTPNPVCATFNATTLPDGNVTGRVTAIDANDNESFAEQTVTKNATPPNAPTFGTFTGTVAYPSGTTANKVNSTSGSSVGVPLSSNENATFTLTVTDSAATPKSVTYGPSGTGTTMSTTITFNPYDFADGILTLVAKATDPQGNESTTSSTTLSKDTTVPGVQNLTVVPSPINDANKASVKVSGTVTKLSDPASGPTESGSSVSVAVDCATGTDPAAVTSTVAADGSFSTTVNTTNCADASSNAVTIKVTPTDGHGNVGNTATNATGKDTVAPTLTNLNGTAITTASPSSTVTANASEPVTVAIKLTDRLGGSVTATATSAQTTPFAISKAVDGSSLADGTITITMTATDTAGNVSATVSKTVVKDTTVFAFVSATPNGTAGRMTTVTGTFNEVLDTGNSTITVRNAADNTPVSGNRSFSSDGKTIIFTPSGGSFPADGSYIATITGKDSGPDNDLAVTKTNTFTIDGTVPAAPTLSTITNPVTSNNDDAVHVTGTAEANSTVTITVTDTTAGTALTATGSAKAGADGTFDVTVNVTPLKDGTLTATGKATDAGNNTSAASGPLTTTKDATPPTVSNVGATDTTQATPKTTVTATASENDRNVEVTLTDADGKKVGPVATKSSATNGAISVQVDASTLKDGVITASVVVFDAVGNASTPGTKTFTKDATGPTVTGLAAAAVNIAAAGKTTVSGSIGEPGTVAFTVSDGTTTLNGTATAAANGSFSTSFDVSSLKDGTLTVLANGKDAKANTGPSAQTTAVKDTVKPAVTGLAATPTNATTNVTTVTGTTEAGLSVLVSITDGTKSDSKTVTAGSDGKFSTTFDLTGYKTGSLPVTARATDAAGNVGDNATATSTRDVSGPTVTNVAASAVNASKTTTTVTGKVDDNTATVALKATDKNGATKTGTATVASDGTFSGTLDLASLADGTVTILATATDPAGNTGSASTTLTKDTSAPAVTGLAATAVTGSATSTTVTGSTEAGATVAITVTDKNGAKKTGTATAGSNGSFSATVDVSTLADGTLTVAAVATDATGNSGAAATTTANKDATGPAVSNLTASASTTAAPGVVVSGSVDDKAATVSVTATDKNAKTVTANAPVNSGNGTFSVTLDVSTLAEGSLTVKATATDTVGNTGTATVTTVKDQTAPVITNLSATASTNSSPTSTVKGNVDDKTATVAVVATDKNSKTVSGTATVNSSTGAFTASLDLSSLADGSITVKATGTDSVGNVGAPATTTTTRDSTAAVRFAKLTPARILDTRSGNGANGPVQPGASVSLQVLGRGGVPATGVSAVVINVTAVSPSAAGYVTVYPSGTTRPTASNLNFVAGQTVPNLVVVPVGSDGKVVLFNGSAGTLQLLGDVSGYYTAGAASAPGAFGALTPARVLDTRSSNGAAGPVKPSTAVSLQVLGRGGVPTSNVSAVVLNVTVVNPTAAGYVTVYPSGTTRPTASNLNFVKGQTVPNLVVVPVGADGKVALFNGSPGTVQLLADVAGYYVGGSVTASGAFGAVSPSRVLDTRSGSPVSSAGTVSVKVTGTAGVPATGVSAVVINVTAVSPAAAGFVTVYPSGTARPLSSNLNFVKGQTVPNLVVVPVGSDGKITLYNGSAGGVHLLGDVAGYYLS